MGSIPIRGAYSHIAQLAERRTVNAEVEDSNSSVGAGLYFGGLNDYLEKISSYNCIGVGINACRHACLHHRRFVY